MSDDNMTLMGESSLAETFPLDIQDAEENFDLALIAALEIDVIPYLGEPCIPDYLIIQLAKMLHQGSQLRDADSHLPRSPATIAISNSGSQPEGYRRNDTESDRMSQEFEKLEKFGETELTMGTTEDGHFLPRERFSYWCFDLLFLICSDAVKGMSYPTSLLLPLSVTIFGADHYVCSQIGYHHENV